MSRFVKRMAHVALCVPDLDASVAWATAVLGLRESERVDGRAYLTHGSCHHSLEYVASDRSALDHVAMEAHDDAALDALAAVLDEQGIAYDETAERAVRRALRFRGGEGHLFEIFVGMDCDEPEFTQTGIPVRAFGHPTITCEDTLQARHMFEDVLDFRLSDEIGDGLLFFLRCNVEHHGMGIQRGRPGLNHYAWRVDSLSELGLLGDALAEHGGRFIWGPGRHGAGRNLFTYHFDPAGAVVEVYADMLHVDDDATYVPGKWPLDDHRGQNLWGPTTPPELIEAVAPLG
jgi:catechol 2,3-dioxygenase-like lactoylglutathione lyase family enzyme